MFDFIITVGTVTTMLIIKFNAEEMFILDYYSRFV